MDEKVIQAGMFNNRSTGSERHNLLKSILRADDMEEEEENEAPDDETINQMIARFLLSTSTKKINLAFFLNLYAIITGQRMSLKGFNKWTLKEGDRKLP